MRSRIASGLLLVVAAINLTPSIVFFQPGQAQSLYGLALAGVDISVLTRHRAVMLGLLGMAMIYAAFRRWAVVPVVVAAFIGKAAFLYLVYTAEGVSSEIGRVALFDIASLFLLATALVLHLTRAERKWITR